MLNAMEYAATVDPYTIVTFRAHDCLIRRKTYKW